MTTETAKAIVKMFDRLDALKANEIEAWSRVFAGDGDPKQAKRLANKIDRLEMKIGKLC